MGGGHGHDDGHGHGGHDAGHGAGQDASHGSAEIPPAPATRWISPARSDYEQPWPGSLLLWPAVWLGVAALLFTAARTWSHGWAHDDPAGHDDVADVARAEAIEPVAREGLRGERRGRVVVEDGEVRRVAGRETTQAGFVEAAAGQVRAGGQSGQGPIRARRAVLAVAEEGRL